MVIRFPGSGRSTGLVHLANEIVDKGLAITMVAALNKVGCLAGAEATIRAVELEGPKEVGGGLEVWTAP